MSETNAARDVIWPQDPDVLVRVVFLYAGQGASAVVLAADGDNYKTMLVDINLDAKNGGVDVPALVADLVGDEDLGIFVNTHPHDDHLRGIKELSDKVGIGEVWHSGHVPSKKHGAAYADLEAVIKKVKRAGGTEVKLLGSRSAKILGEADYYVLAPAEYVADEVNEAEADERYQRIHEQCAVLKIGTGDSWVLLPGDADRDAFEQHIAEYHKERLGAKVLAASHHGSRDFFQEAEDDEPYLDALDSIDPEYVVVSAPTQEESRHGHPHDEAMTIYGEHCTEDNVLHTGANRYCFICDIYRDGSYSGVEDDKGALAEAYPLEDPDDDGGKGITKAAIAFPSVITRVDDRPMGAGPE